MPRLNSVQAEALRERLYCKIIKYPNDVQSASEWKDSGFSSFSTAQVKRQLEQLVSQDRIKAHRHPGIVYYGSLTT